MHKIPAFFITNIEKQEANSTGQKHVNRVNDYGDFDAKIFPAVKGKEAYDIFKENRITFLKKPLQTDDFIQRNQVHKYEEKAGIAGCFASHFLLWQECYKSKQTIGIFEYDAMQIQRMPKNFSFKNILYLSAWRNFNNNPENYEDHNRGSGVQDYVGYDRWGYKDCMSGTHAYLLTPAAAKVLISTTKSKGWFPADRFFSIDIVPLSKQTLVPAIFKVKNSLNLSYSYEHAK